MSPYYVVVIWFAVGMILQAVVLSEKGAVEGIRPKDIEEVIGTVIAMIVIAFVWPIIVPEVTTTIGIKFRRLFS